MIETERDQALRGAMTSVLEAASGGDDPDRPQYHFTAPAQWLNDPNGTLYHEGWYHLFYQHNPYGTAWGHMHWGHARSRDLVDWEHLPIALWPSKTRGEDHVFSGTAAVTGSGRVVALYTSIGPRQPEQWLATAEDPELLTWAKLPANPVMDQSLHGATPVAEWRDPFLFRAEGRTFVVCGGNRNANRGGEGRVLLYVAEDEELTRWRFLGDVFRHPEARVRNIECPNLFPLDGRWVLITSPHGRMEYFVGDLDLAKPRLVWDRHGFVDLGQGYASNLAVDDRGRSILFAWSIMGAREGRPWTGYHTLPRVLSLGPDGYLRQTPVPELAKLRGDEVTLPPRQVDDTAKLEGVRGDLLELLAEFEPGDAKAFGLRVRANEAGEGGAVLRYEPGSRTIDLAGRREVLVQPEDGLLRLHVYLDKLALEVFVNDGAAAAAVPMEVAAGDLAVHAFSEGGTCRLRSLRAWPLRPAVFDRARFRAG